VWSTAQIACCFSLLCSQQLASTDLIETLKAQIPKDRDALFAYPMHWDVVDAVSYCVYCVNPSLTTLPVAEGHPNQDEELAQ
jgi:hypothetical protein